MSKLGVTFPQTEIGSDPIVVRDFAQAVEGMGYQFLLTYDHVLGANPDRPGGWSGPYTYKHSFHEIFVLYGYLAGLTQRIELVTGILILPQRQTVLVAKQAAEIDVLSRGRLRLGIGIGWNAVEYEALGMNFHDRGRRAEEQVALLRRLWTEELVTFEGRWHRVTDAGLNPPPVQRPIPILMGGYAEPVLKRVARLADGWIALGNPVNNKPQIERLRQYTREAGRSVDSVRIIGGLSLRQTTPDGWRPTLAAWEDAGAHEVTVNTMGAGFKTPDEHIEAIRRVKNL
ncbi:MAG: LLM class F420-dependent oxidoreductase [Chloroflexi bacterium]|nr:LLM class F420-dependent oxidoreductase [Chloroflexota bacterium]